MAQHSWTAAGQKMLTRARSWDYSRLGLYYATCAHNLYVSSLPSYVGQLESYPDEFQEVEEATLRRAAAGPYAWALPQDLFRPKGCYGQAANFRSLRHAAIAAKVRVCRYENQAHGGLHVRTRARKLRALVATSTRTVRAATWNDWIQNNPRQVLDNALNHCSSLGCAILAIEDRAAGPEAQRPHTPPQAARVRQQFQSTLSLMLRRKEPYDEEHRMRHKFQRWNLTVLPRLAATRALNRLNYLDKHAPPRVGAAALSTLWNRWTTARRFQFFSPCCLGCSDTAADSIEHYAHCPLVRRAAKTELRLQLREWPRPG